VIFKSIEKKIILKTHPRVAPTFVNLRGTRRAEDGIDGRRDVDDEKMTAREDHHYLRLLTTANARTATNIDHTKDS
jgi:hypothetical protein